MNGIVYRILSLQIICFQRMINVQTLHYLIKCNVKKDLGGQKANAGFVASYLISGDASRPRMGRIATARGDLCVLSVQARKQQVAEKPNREHLYTSYHIISYHIISFHIISYHIISYHIISYHIISYHIISYHIISYHIISYHIISYHIISYHIISYHIYLFIYFLILCRAQGT